MAQITGYLVYSLVLFFFFFLFDIRFRIYDSEPSNATEKSNGRDTAGGQSI